MDTTPPECWIIGGTNGAGKSSIHQISPELRSSGEFVNADLITRDMAPERPESVSNRAGRQVIARLDELISARGNFVYETTLSSHQSIDLMNKSRNVIASV